MQLILESKPTEGEKINMSMHAETPVSKDMNDIIILKEMNQTDKENNPNIGECATDTVEKNLNNKTEINEKTSVPDDIVPKDINTNGNQKKTCSQQVIDTLNKIDSNGLCCTQDEKEGESTKYNVEITTNEHKDVDAKIQVTEDTHEICENSNKSGNLIFSEDSPTTKKDNSHEAEENSTKNISLAVTSEDITEILKTSTEKTQEVESASAKKIAEELNAPKLNLEVIPHISETSNENKKDTNMSIDSSSTNIEPVLLKKNDKIDSDDVVINSMFTNKSDNVSDVVTNKQTDKLSNDATLTNKQTDKLSNDPENLEIVEKSDDVSQVHEIPQPSEVTKDIDIDVDMNEEPNTLVNDKTAVPANIVEPKTVNPNEDPAAPTIKETSGIQEEYAEVSEALSDIFMSENPIDTPIDVSADLKDTLTKETDKSAKTDNNTSLEKDTSLTKEIDKVSETDNNTSLEKVESVRNSTETCEKEIITMEIDDIEVVDLDNKESDKNISVTSLVSVVDKETEFATITNPESPSQINENEIERLISEGVKALEREKREEIVPMETDEVEIVDLEKDKQDENICKIESVSNIIENGEIVSAETTDQQLIAPNIDTTDSTLVQKQNEAKKVTPEEQVEILDEDDIKIVENKQEEISTKNQEKEKSPELAKTLPVICKLSNTLDILSDDEEESSKESPKVDNSSEEKQCINIDDDDDIMLIEEDSNSKDAIDKSKSALKIENDKETDSKLNKKIDIDPVEKNVAVSVVTESTPSDDTSPASPPNRDSVLPTEKTPEREVENTKPTKPLVAQNFLKTAKKNIAEMSRHELEDFCILRIVESIVDRSNLSDIKTKMKTMAQTLEDFRKRTSMLTKQNRDLQVVLKSVQEEQKNRTNGPIQPLKITRSVGMQVLMNDKVEPRRKGPAPNQPAAVPTASGRTMRTVQVKMVKPAVTPSTIPVPRKVPVNSSPAKPVTNSSPVNIASKSPCLNGLRNPSPVQKAPEKRTHSRMQSTSSVTVDLTDDEPPPKINIKNAPVTPVRVVAPQNLLAQQRPFSQPLNNPRKVYIPIGTPGQPIRAGQALVMRNNSPSGPRQRLPAPRLSSAPVRFNRPAPQRHPAPLPDAMKQYTPPTWKPLPPAPDLKLSKVENGIVISWKMDDVETDFETIASYQLYAYQETNAPPNTSLWKKIGDVKALPLPMACTLTQFMAGFKYYFAVRAVDIRSRLGPFSLPGSILLLNKI